MDPYELQERQRLAEEAAERVMRDVPRSRVEEGQLSDAGVGGQALLAAPIPVLGSLS